MTADKIVLIKGVFPESPSVNEHTWTGGDGRRHNTPKVKQYKQRIAQMLSAQDSCVINKREVERLFVQHCQLAENDRPMVNVEVHFLYNNPKRDSDNGLKILIDGICEWLHIDDRFVRDIPIMRTIIAEHEESRVEVIMYLTTREPHPSILENRYDLVQI